MSETERPLVTLAVLVFNQAQYIQEAVECALAQDYSPLEIIFSDDCSSDDSFPIMQRILQRYDGPHKVCVRRNSSNGGLAEHVNKINNLAGGRLIVVAAGDDVSEPSRVTVLLNSWLQHGAPACSLFSAMTEIDQKSLVTGKVYRTHRSWCDLTPMDMVQQNIGVFGAAHAWSIEVARSFPPMHNSVINEDHVIPFRSALLGGVIYVDIPLVRYRANIGLASNFGNGSLPSKNVKRSPQLLRRPYVVYVQKTADIRWLSLENKKTYSVAKSRRADYLFRYWLSAEKKFTNRKMYFFFRRCRMVWVLREILLNSLSKN